MKKCSQRVRNDVGHKLAVNVNSGDIAFELYIKEKLPLNHRLATVQEVKNHRHALLKAMPGWEIANLADGSLEGALYGGFVR